MARRLGRSGHPRSVRAHRGRDRCEQRARAGDRAGAGARGGERGDGLPQPRQGPRGGRRGPGGRAGRSGAAGGARSREPGVGARLRRALQRHPRRPRPADQQRRRDGARRAAGPRTASSSSSARTTSATSPLTTALLEKMEGREDARVVTLSSTAHKMGRINFDNLNGDRHYFRWNAYGQSKLANLLFALELDRRLRADGSTVKSLAAHPGYAATNLQSAGAAAVRPPRHEGGVQRRDRAERRDGRAADPLRRDPAGSRRRHLRRARTASGSSAATRRSSSRTAGRATRTAARRLWEVSERTDSGLAAEQVPHISRTATSSIVGSDRSRRCRCRPSVWNHSHEAAFDSIQGPRASTATAPGPAPMGTWP